MLALSIRRPPRFDIIAGYGETILCTPGNRCTPGYRWPRFFSAHGQDWVAVSELEIGQPLTANFQQPSGYAQVIGK